MKITFTTIIIFCSLTIFGQSKILDSNIVHALNEVNRIRHTAGLDSVSLSKELSIGCTLHAKYLAINKGNPKVRGLNAHKEFSTLKGATPEGKKAGEKSVIHYVLPKPAVIGWEATFYHRIPLLQPKLKEIGIGYYAPSNSFPITLVECISGNTGTDTTSIVYYPAKGQSKVPTVMGPEIPHPMGRQGDYGYPITIYFTNFQEIKSVEFKLELNGKTINCSVSNPQQKATDFSQWNTICAIPFKPLKPNSTYKVTFKCTIDGKKHEEQYYFNT